MSGQESSFRLWPPALASILIASMAACGGGPQGDPEAPEARPAAARSAPNVVVVMTDDQTTGSVRLMPEVKRELSRRGITFRENFATTPQCCPSRATFFTGQYSHNHEVFSSDEGYASMADKPNILPAWLQAAGYETGHVGKYINGYGNPGDGGDPKEVPEGWDFWSAPVDHTEYQMYGFTLNRDGRLKEYGDRPGAYQTDVFADEAVRFIEEASGKRPFFLSVAPTAPHSEGELEGEAAVTRNPRPAPRHLGDLEDVEMPRSPSFGQPVDDAPEAIQRKIDRRADNLSPDALEPVVLGRAESLLAVDDLVGRLVHSLEAADELDETYVFFTSDNGILLGEHGLSGKVVPYEEAVRVPLIVRGPGVEPGSAADGLAANIDLAPTIAELAQAEPGREVDGKSLVPAFGGEVLPERDIGLEYLVGREAFTGVRTGRWMFARYGTGGAELYDMRNDPFQLRNLIEDPGYAKVEARLRQATRRTSECAGVSCR